MKLQELKSRRLWSQLLYMYPSQVVYEHCPNDDVLKPQNREVLDADLVGIHVNTVDHTIKVSTWDCPKDWKPKVDKMTVEQCIFNAQRQECTGLTPEMFKSRVFHVAESDLSHKERWIKAYKPLPPVVAKSLVIYSVTIDDLWIIVYEDIHNDQLTQEYRCEPTCCDFPKLGALLQSSAWRDLINTMINPSIIIKQSNVDIDNANPENLYVSIVNICPSDNGCVIYTHEINPAHYEPANSLRLYLSHLGVFNGSGAGDSHWKYYICAESDFADKTKWVYVSNTIPVEIMNRRVRFVITCDDQWVTVYDDTTDADPISEEIYSHCLELNYIDGDTYVINHQ